MGNNAARALHNFPRIRGYDEENTRRTGFFWEQRSAICQTRLKILPAVLLSSTCTDDDPGGGITVGGATGSQSAIFFHPR